MLPALTSLIAVQRLDTAAEAARRRLAELPLAEQAIETAAAAVQADVERAQEALAANQQQRRTLERDVAQVDSRLARFDEHKAAVKTNQEYTALLHEIATAKQEKDAVEEQILILLEAADTLTADLKRAETARSEGARAGDEARRQLTAERQALDRELARLAAERADAIRDVDPPLLARYDQLLKQRRMLAVAAMVGESCTGCNVRLRPSIAQQVRRNDAIVQCDSCQRILYFVPKDPA
jgi:predicted  nucleic acid-binding Zn-ribbon protein